MRVVLPAPDRAVLQRRSPAVRRAANLELLGLTACTAVVLLGVLLTGWGKAAGSASRGRDLADGTIVDLHRISSPNQIAPLLTMFESPFERQAVARALYRRAALDVAPLDHVGALASVTIPAAEIRNDRRFVELRSRLGRRPALESVPVLTPADLAAIKPRLVVRTPQEFRARIAAALAWFFAAFWLAHGARRWRRTGDDPVLLPALMGLSGIGLMSMVTLRDPLRDTVLASAFVGGIVGGSLLATLASQVDLEASALRRAVLVPFGLAVALAALLLAFGTGPGASGAKVNVLGVQPVEAIRLLVVLALAGYFARRLEFLRELSEEPTPARPWLRYVRVPRWRDVRPVAFGMCLVLTFFFLQKDLGPALVLSCVFLALYGVARGRAVLVAIGLAILLGGFVAAHAVGFPATVRQRVAIWFDPWTNGVPGGDQIAHGLWALSTGRLEGSGPGLGSPQVIPAAHTDFVLAAVGEELGFVGLAVVAALYGVLCWRCLRIAARAPGDYTAFVAAGVALGLVVQAFVIASGVLGLLPLSGVVTPFLSYGRSSMLANFAAVGIVMGIATRQGRVRSHFAGPIRALAAVMAVAAAALVSRAVWIQIVRADRFATAACLSEQGDGGYRYTYNPRLLAAGHLVGRGTIYDRNGLPLATSRADEVQSLAAAYRTAGIAPQQSCAAEGSRCYPLAGLAFHLLGDLNDQTNWGARNSSYVERDSDATLKGFDDRVQVVTVVNPRTGAREQTMQRDFRELLPLARDRYRRNDRAVQALLTRDRDVRLSIDARLQLRAATVLRSRIEAGGYARGAAAVLDVDTGEVLASVSYPWPTTEDLENDGSTSTSSDRAERLLDRPRYGLYPPGSAFKLLVAGAALRTNSAAPNGTFACIRLPDGRVGNYVPGSSRPVRDDPLDTVPHGTVALQRGLVVSCNAYFAQLAVRLGPQPLLEAASLFQIDVAHPQTPASLKRTLAQAGYGQGQVVVSPLKMAQIAAAIGGRGVIPPIRWMRGSASRPPQPDRRFLAPADAALLSRYMRDVVTSGTGRTLLPNAIAIAGKTGTAEVAGDRAHSWFAGFAPFGASAHKIAFAVIVENAGYGARAAAPIAGDLVTAARDIGLFK